MLGSMLGKWRFLDGLAGRPWFGDDRRAGLQLWLGLCLRLDRHPTTRRQLRECRPPLILPRSSRCRLHRHCFYNARFPSRSYPSTASSIGRPPCEYWRSLLLALVVSNAKSISM